MARVTKIGNNEPCPCGSRQKYKRCCKGKIDWESLAAVPTAQYARNLTIRGKNLLFLGSLLEALQIDDFKKLNFPQLKKAFTPKVVRQIHTGIVDSWPDLDDYETSLTRESRLVTGLYTGTYEPAAVLRAVARHALYSERIYLIDPFLDPRATRDEFNPVLHPEEHRSNAIRYSFLWLTLFPWIQAGIVNFVRPIHNFIPGLQSEILSIQRKKAKDNPELLKLLDEEVEAEAATWGPMDGGLTEYHFLSFSDEFFRETFHKLPPDKPFRSEEEFLSLVKRRRETHPYYVDPLPGEKSQLIQETSGANYELAKRMCALTNSHIITDLKYRWKELELDRANSPLNDDAWSPFAKALQNSPLKVLSDIPIAAALQLREENRLERMRLFFSKVWKSCREPNHYSNVNATNLAAELSEKIAEAEAEWKKIDEELFRWFGGAGVAAVTGAVAGFFPALPAAAIGGTTALFAAQLKRNSFKDRYPAGFFLGLKKKQ